MAIEGSRRANAGRIRYGMVGGGQGAYIGNIHRLASRLDGQWQLVAGAFDVDPERGRAFAISQGLDPARSYGTYQELIAGEAGREDRVDAVAICTPNFTHYPIAKALIEAGFDVICEKPLTATLEAIQGLGGGGGARGLPVGSTDAVVEPPAAATGSGQDVASPEGGRTWTPDPERVVWNWPDLADRIVEEE